MSRLQATRIYYQFFLFNMLLTNSHYVKGDIHKLWMKLIQVEVLESAIREEMSMPDTDQEYLAGLNGKFIDSIGDLCKLIRSLKSSK